MGLIIGCIAVCYSILIIRLVIAFERQSLFYFEPAPAKHHFSIIIPFRNEAQHLPALLNTIAQLKYPRDQFEVWFVDDASEDNSRAIIDTFTKTHDTLNISILENERLSNSPKKDAITTAINQVSFDWIITTDADCFLPELWLQAYDRFITNNTVTMIVAPVSYVANGSWFQQFQLTDFLSLQSATIAGFGMQRPFLCNGANLCYQTAFFKEVSGFQGNDTIASGDDIFLMEKMLQYAPEQLHYLKFSEATVYTSVQPNLQALLQQRVRWAAKSSHYKNPFAKGVGLLVFLMNASILLSFALGITDDISWNFFALLLITKTIIDYVFIYKSVQFFKQGICLKHYLISSLVYPIFSVYVVFHAALFKYQWKGRYFKK